jgi:hypothetical protein
MSRNKWIFLTVVVALLVSLLPLQSPTVAAQSERLKITITVTEADLTSIANLLISVVPGLADISEVSVDLKAPDRLCFNAKVPTPLGDISGYLCYTVTYEDYRLKVVYHSAGFGSAPRAVVDDVVKAITKPLKKLAKKSIKAAVKSAGRGYALTSLQITDTELILTISDK